MVQRKESSESESEGLEIKGDNKQPNSPFAEERIFKLEEELKKFQPKIAKQRGYSYSKYEESDYDSYGYEEEEEKKVFYEDSELKADEINKILVKNNQIFYDVDVIN